MDKWISPIIKPTNNCNLSCDYCYVSNKEKTIMNEKTTRNLIEKTLAFNGKDIETEFIWHGGEPLLAGLDFYKNVVEILENFKDFRYENTIQTNLTLLTNEFLEFFIENGFSIGTSIDGLEDIHNITRHYSNGKGSFSKVMEGINLIKENGIRPSAILTLNKHNLDHIEEIYDFFKENNIDFRINPVFSLGKEERRKAKFSITPEEYGITMTKLFDKWFYDGSIEIATFSTILGNYIDNSSQDCGYSGKCQQHYILVEPNGDVYPCDKFDGLEEFKIGNINEQSLEAILNSSIRQKLMSRSVDKIEECNGCDYKRLCNAGCMYDAFVEYGDFNKKTYFCEGEKIMFEHITKTVKNELDNARIS